MRLLVVITALASACGGSTTEVELALTTDDCTALKLSPVTHVSVQVWGLDGDGDSCQLAKRCIDLGGRPTSLADISVALHDATQPLIDMEAAGAVQIAIIGHRSQGCASGEQDLCGVADIAAAADDVLEIDVICERTIMDDRCGSESLPLCP